MTSLRSRIDDINAAEAAVSERSVVSLLEDCKTVMKRSAAFYRSVDEPQKLLDLEPTQNVVDLTRKIIQNPKLPLSSDILHAYFTCRPFPDTQDAISALELFYKRNKDPKAFVDPNVAMIPLRNALLRNEIKDAIRIIDLSAAHPRWRQHASRAAMKGVYAWLGFSGGVMVAAEALMRSGAFGLIESTLWLQSMLAAYLGNTGILLYIVMAGRRSDAAGRVTWARGFPQHKWYPRAQELIMMTKVAEADELNPENNGEVSPYVRSELARRNMMLLQSEDEANMKEYWARGGEGFTWVEPDQDPADLLRRQKLQTTPSIAPPNLPKQAN
ncbi:hypothetical protein CANCADRAFT_3004 [Tortispora caseinolytica NRRL Y-17796]|uniref:Uncharacterized protein n=1 Tax=Tortispora caseinolytica NRRL Y-17796 TaxID=767744 RepID=A0A1E4THS8_9ASCO|nr:hypothetical protein CANCADRAFT_3004 [Tortispora caseinolytica NRRL Y-17796]